VLLAWTWPTSAFPLPFPHLSKLDQQPGHNVSAVLVVPLRGTEIYIYIYIYISTASAK
jgi:hypothetical protein